MSKELQPIPFKEANDYLPGRTLSIQEQIVSKKEKATPIPCYKNETVIVTRWKLAGFWNRVRFVLKGEVNIMVLGTTQPPLKISIDTPFEKS